MGVYLSKPDLKKNTKTGEIASLRWVSSAMQGWRTQMEDAHIAQTDIQPGVHLFAVFDGHGGPEVARFCSAKFVETLLKNEKFKAAEYKEALEQTFLAMDKLILDTDGQQALRQFKNEPDALDSYAGCTANVCLIVGDTIYCANAGDSRAYVFPINNKAEMLSTDHKPDLPAERDRVVAAGGAIRNGRINDNLNLARAIGDFEYKKNTSLPPEKQMITAFPEVKTHKLDKDTKVLILGCDGIWEMKHVDQICASFDLAGDVAALAKSVEETLDTLVAKDTSEGTGCDNMSAVVVHFKTSLPSGKE